MFSVRTLVVLGIALVLTVAAAVFVLRPAMASADIFDNLLYAMCHDHEDNNGGGGIDLLDPACAEVQNAAPEAFNQALATTKNAATSTTLTGSDSDSAGGHDGDILYFSITDLPQNGTLSCGGNPCNFEFAYAGSTGVGGMVPEVTYTPNADFVGQDWFSFCASDGLLCDEATVTIEVAEPAPVIPTCTENQTLVNNVCVDNPAPQEEENNNQNEENNGGNGGGSQSVAQPQCNDGIDNDNDGRVDYPLDNSCFDKSDDSEGNDGGAFFASSGGNSGSGGSSGGSGGSSSAGSGVVLGASTDIPVCSTPMLTSYLRFGRDNDVSQVKKLQEFLNLNLGATLEVNGIFDAATLEAVKTFQLKYDIQVLKPWKPWGLKDGHATGYVYKTTQRMINALSCPSLTLPEPQLP